MPTLTDLSLDTVQLSNLSVKVGAELTDFIAEKVFPVIPVAKKDGYFYTFSNDHLRVEEAERAASGRANRVDYGMSTTAYGPLVDFEYEMPVDDHVAQQSPIDLVAAAVRQVTERMAIFKEDKLATLLNNTSNVTNNTTLTGTNQWTDATNSDPFGDIQTGASSVIQNSGRKPNVLFMGQASWNKFSQHPDVIERVKHIWGGSTLKSVRITEEEATKLLGMQVMVGSSIKNSADEGAADSLGFIWPDSCWVAYVTPSPGLMTATAGYHFTLENAKKVDTYRDDSIRSNVVRMVDYFNPKIVSVGAIYLIKDTNA